MSAFKNSNIKFLKELAKARGRKRIKLIENAGNSHLNAISEVALNLKNGNLPVHPKLRRKLGRYRDTIYKLGSKRVRHAGKRKLLLQKDGAIPLIVAPFLSAIGTVAGRILSDVIAKKDV
jgi:hypothetical protein